MSKRSITPLKGQGALFEEAPRRKNGLKTWQELEGQTGDLPIPSYGPAGSYVDVKERAQHLANALEAFGRRNQRLGFDVAIHSDAYKDPIWRHYLDVTPVVIEGAQNNVENFLNEAKANFWAATGFQALRGSGLVGEQGLIKEPEVVARSRKMWRDFSGEYGDPKDRPARDKYKKKLEKMAGSKSKTKTLSKPKPIARTTRQQGNGPPEHVAREIRIPAAHHFSEAERQEGLRQVRQAREQIFGE